MSIWRELVLGPMIGRGAVGEPKQVAFKLDTGVFAQPLNCIAIQLTDEGAHLGHLGLGEAGLDQIQLPKDRWSVGCSHYIHQSLSVALVATPSMPSLAHECGKSMASTYSKNQKCQ